MNVFKLLFFTCLSIGFCSLANGQCSTFSSNLGGNDVSSSSGAFSVGTDCAITNGARLGSGSSDGSATWTIPGGTRYIEIDFHHLSEVSPPDEVEVLMLYVNGSFYNLNTAPSFSYLGAYAGCSAGGSSPYLIDSAFWVYDSSNIGGLAGNIPNTRGTVAIDFGDCIANTITIANDVRLGTSNGMTVQLRYCTDTCTCSAGNAAPILIKN